MEGYSDLDNPEWVASLDISPVANADRHDMHDRNPAIRTLNGALDFFSGLEHDLSEIIQDEIAKGKLPPEALPDWIKDNLPYRINKIEVTADQNPSAAFACQTFTIPAQSVQQAPILVSIRSDRVRLILTNTGANPAYFGHQDDVNTTTPSAGEMDWALIPVLGAGTFQREIRALGKVYVFSPLGTTIDIQEEYGYANRPKTQ